MTSNFRFEAYLLNNIIFKIINKIIFINDSYLLCFCFEIFTKNFMLASDFIIVLQ